MSKICAYCNKEFIPAVNYNEKYCSKQCHVAYDKNRRKNYVKQRRLTDSTFKLISNLRNRVRGALDGNKSMTTIKLLGCTPDELWSHLEKQFKQGMTRNNYGE
jgi:predicted nucleic acid-binding Zn ribbon protein